MQQLVEGYAAAHIKYAADWCSRSQIELDRIGVRARAARQQLQLAGERQSRSRGQAGKFPEELQQSVQPSGIQAGSGAVAKGRRTRQNG